MKYVNVLLYTPLITSVFFLALVFSSVVPVFAETVDLDQDGISDHEDEEVIVTISQSLLAGEYTFHNLIIASSTTLTLVGDPDASGDFKGVKINADNLTIESGSSMSANGTGYTSHEGSPGAGDSNGGYGYGGEGGDWSYKTSSALGGGTYGSAFDPKYLGSGESIKAGGGGAVWLAVSGTLKNDGSISANGKLNKASGGSVYVRTGALDGNGLFTANGAHCNRTWPYSGAGGGGRVAVYYEESEFMGSVEARGGGDSTNTNCRGSRAGQDGTSVFVDTAHNDLYLHGRMLFEESDSPYTFNQIVLLDGASASSESGVNITANTVIMNDVSSFNTEGIHSLILDNLLIDGAATFTSAEDQSLSIASLTIRNGGVAQLGRGETLDVFETIILEDNARIVGMPMHILHLEADDVSIDSTSSISVTGAGYSPRLGPGYNDSKAGASHGGLGERGTPSPTYGSETEPVDFGSGGSTDAYGGGSLRMVVAGTLENNGTISADATPQKNGASGGSIYVTTNTLSGSGAFTARGGNTRGYITDIGAGGGGRIALQYGVSDFVGTTSAKGGDRYVGGAIQKWYYAQDGTVVLSEKEVEASTVLFLPGIQSSRLYKNGIFGTRDRLWEPNINGDVAQLAMTEDGLSVHDIYTRDIVDSVFGTYDIYAGFTEYLSSLTEQGIISGWEAFAYDWRFGVDEIVEYGTRYEEGIRSLVDRVITLAQQKNSRITIIAHSNGGLLAKALVEELTRQNKDYLIDRVMLIASPQLGTPKAIGSLLHGYDQEKLGGFIIDDVTAREIMHNFKGAYGLLPSKKFFELNADPVVSFAPATSTETFVATYGNTINSFAELQAFMRGDEGRVVENDDIQKPSRTNPGMLNDADILHEEIDSWTAPPHIQVVEFVGVGLDTIKGFEYQQFVRRTCIPAGGSIACANDVYYEPVPQFTQYGDETVLALSAEAYAGNKQKYYVDLGRYNNQSEVSVLSHASITNLTPLQEFIKGLLQNSTADVPFVTTTQPSFVNEREVISVHSPVSLSIKDVSGNVVGRVGDGEDERVVTDIPGSSYLEVGGATYAIIPADIDYVATIEGVADGSYTLQRAHLQGEEGPVVLSIRSAATTTSTMSATFSKTAGELSYIATDYSGDGVVDEVSAIDDELPIGEMYTFLRNYFNGFALLKQSERNWLVHRVSKAENTELRKGDDASGVVRIFNQIDDRLIKHRAENLITSEEYAIAKGLITEIINR